MTLGLKGKKEGDEIFFLIKENLGGYGLLKNFRIGIGCYIDCSYIEKNYSMQLI